MITKRIAAALIGIGLLASTSQVFAENLLQVFQQALSYDPLYQKAHADLLSITQDIPITRSFLLPQFNVSGFSQYNNQENRAGATFTLPSTGQSLAFGTGTFNYNSNGYNLDLTQTLFDYAQWATVKEAKLTVKAAVANYAAALQDLMTRTSQAYFNVLSAQDNLRYIEAEKQAIYQQLDQVTQQYKVGVVAITGVYQAQAAYDSIISQEIAAANNVINQRENLRVITGHYYNRLASIRYNVPLLIPKPENPQKWINTAIKQNWSLTAARYTAQAAKEQITVERAGNLPVFDAYAQQQLQKAGPTPNGQINTTINSVGVELNLPIYQGGLVSAQTKQASYNYQSSLDSVTETYRNVYNNTKQSYDNIISGISQVKADRQAIVSNASSLRSTIEGFKVGAQTMLDVLQAQQNLYSAESAFSTDQYNYLNATIALKQAAGTLSLKDLQEINSWLIDNKNEYPSLSIDVIQKQANKNFHENLKDEKLAAEILNAGGNISTINLDSLQQGNTQIKDTLKAGTDPITGTNTLTPGS